MSRTYLDDTDADGNKRTAFVAAFPFLRLNGVVLRPDLGVGGE